MKKLIVFSFALFITATSFAQQKGDITIGAYTGFSSTGFIYRLASNATIDTDSSSSDFIEGSNLPVFGVTADYNLSDRFSIGGMVGIQHFYANVNERVFDAVDTTFRLKNTDVRLNRIYIGIVPKFFYNTSNENMELYSAVRAGFILWQGNFDVENSNLDALSGFGGGRPALSIVAIGGRYFFNESLAFNFEVATGAPALLTFGLNYKL